MRVKRSCVVVSVVLAFLLVPLAQVSASTPISIGTNGVIPERALVRLGDAARWMNDDSRPHRIVSSPEGFFQTDRMPPGTSEAVVFISAGSFPYSTGAASGVVGVVSVPVGLRPGPNTVPTPGATITIRVAIKGCSDCTYDVQRKRNNGPWVTIAQDTSAITVEFQPHRMGYFWFRARVTDTSADITSKWSVPRVKLVAPPP